MDIASLAIVVIVLVLATTTIRTVSIIDRLVRIFETHLKDLNKQHRKDRRRRTT